MNTVDKIYELINKDNTINTFNNNLELFQEFYYHNMMIRYNGAKVIEIYKYLLSLNISEYHETMPYLNSKIFEDFNNYELILTQSVYSKTTQVDDDYVDLLYNLINEYNQFKLYENQGSLTKLLSENRFIRDYTGSMMIILNSSFFKLSNENINKMMDSIKNNNYLQSIIEEGKMGKQLLDADYIFQYTSRFLFNAEFINEDNIDNDLLLNAIKDSKIKDLKTLKKIFKDVDIYILFSFFDCNITQFVDMLGQSFKDDLDKIEVFKILYNKLIEANGFRVIMDFMINDDRSNIYMNDDERKYILNEFCCHYPGNITDEEINYVLNQEYNQLFLLNLKEDLKKNNWSEDTKNKVQKLTENIIEYDYDFNDSIKKLELLFKKSEPIDVVMLISSFKRLIKDYLHDENIKIYVIKDDNINGCANHDENYINLNYNVIESLLETYDYEKNPESIHILETIFHEARHIQQFACIREGNMSDDIYEHYKEDILLNINSPYYKKNYVGISFERDARITGSKMLVSLLKTYFPYMKECISHYEDKGIKELGQEIATKHIFELSEGLSIDEVLEKLISINPDIIDRFPGLKCEYNNKINSNKDELLHIER